MCYDPLQLIHEKWERIVKSRLIALIAVSVLLMSCSKAATFNMRDGSTTRAQLTSSTDDEYTVTPEGGEGEETLTRADVESIDHPGWDHTIAGLVVAGVGLGTGIAGATILGTINDGVKSEDTRIPEDDVDSLLGISLLFGGISALVIGGAVASWGYNSYSRSKASAVATPSEDDDSKDEEGQDETKDESTQLIIAPTTLSDGEKLYYGLGLGFSF